jgi:hypothetical protein
VGKDAAGEVRLVSASSRDLCLKVFILRFEDMATFLSFGVEDDRLEADPGSYKIGDARLNSTFSRACALD